MAKRNGGQLTCKRIYRVLAESKRQPNGSWRHKCGSFVMTSEVKLSHRDDVFPLAGDGKVKTIEVPYCPACELQPIRGTFTDNGRWIIGTYA